MNHTVRIARDDAIVEALKAATQVIGDDAAEPQALRIVEAIKRLREGAVRVASLNPIDYLERVQRAAREAWHTERRPTDTGPEFDATAGVDTPLGRLSMVAWRRPWNGRKTGQRVAWAGEYYLDGRPITVAEIRAAGLAQRPTTRRRQKDG